MPMADEWIPLNKKPMWARPFVFIVCSYDKFSIVFPEWP